MTEAHRVVYVVTHEDKDSTGVVAAFATQAQAETFAKEAEAEALAELEEGEYVAVTSDADHPCGWWDVTPCPLLDADDPLSAFERLSGGHTTP